MRRYTENMEKETDMTIDEIRTALDRCEARFTEAMKANDFQEARDQRTARDYFIEQLVRKIQEEDPYTTEADVRYYEGF